MRVYIAVELTATDGPRKSFEYASEALENEIEALDLEVEGGSGPTLYEVRVVGIGRNRETLSESEDRRRA